MLSAKLGKDLIGGGLAKVTGKSTAGTSSDGNTAAKDPVSLPGFPSLKDMPTLRTPFNLPIGEHSGQDELASDPFSPGEAYGDVDADQTDLLKDLASAGLLGSLDAIKGLLTVLKEKNTAEDDRLLTTERLMAFITKLPRTSKTRAKLTNVVIAKLWNSLQHPPLSYLGDKFKYRTADGQNNNPLNPMLGASGTPYAKTVRSQKKMAGVKPDAGLLFDLLLQRGEFQENPAGVSSVLFYHATIIIHDIFRTNRMDHNISDTSSYLDLAPLYGSTQADQDKIRTFKQGLLKPDTFSEKRLLGQPPGVNVMLVLYSRFHNYAAQMLLAINEDSKFTLRTSEDEEEKKAAILKQDNDLFQTARLITGGLYVNCSLHDYLRGLTNTHHSPSDWTLDPRIAGTTYFNSDGVPRGVGNQCSVEFNLLYRFHSAISQRDEKWLIDFFNREVFPGNTKPLEELSVQEFMAGLFKYDEGIPTDPSVREFGGIKRGSDGKFKDEDLVRILKDSMEAPAGLFGARTIPKAMRVVEVLGILQARKWGVASLNEMRDFFKLKRYETFEEINSDPEIAGILRSLYTHPDLVELYPGMFIEEAKPRMDPGMGGCLPYTASRAVFSDAITLVRSDRFLTIDYNVDTLTNWGLAEITPDYDTLGGSMYYRLIQRGVPGWFPYNSLHAMQPLFTRAMNETIARELKTLPLYSTADPAPPRNKVFVQKYDTVVKIVTDPDNFRVPWAKGVAEAVPDRDLSDFMLAGDAEVNKADRATISKVFAKCGDLGAVTAKLVAGYGAQRLQKSAFHLSATMDQIDIIRDVAIPVNTRMVSDLLNLDLRTEENPDGSLSSTEMYKALIDLRTWCFQNSDPAQSWARRRWATQAAATLTESTNQLNSAVLHDAKVSNLFGGLNIHAVAGLHVDRANKTTAGSARAFGRKFVVDMVTTAGKTPEETADAQWLVAFGGIGGPVTMFAEVLEFFFRPENKDHWAALQDLAATTGDAASKATASIRAYVTEAFRLVHRGKVLRVCAKPKTINGQEFKPGDYVISLIGPAMNDKDAVPNPEAFKTDRPKEAYLFYNAGPHACFGGEIATVYVTEMIRLVAGLKDLRPAPGEMGVLKYITLNGEKLYLSENWAYMTYDPTTWKLHYNGHGKGVYQPPASEQGIPERSLDESVQDWVREHLKAHKAARS